MTLTLHLTPFTRQQCLTFQANRQNSRQGMASTPSMAQPRQVETFTAVSLMEYEATLAEELHTALPATLQNANPSIDVANEDFDEIFHWYLA